jgi:hypothetical protein
MAINITSLPVGVYKQSGNGVPTHISPKGTEYTDLDTAIVYINKNGVASWAEFLDSTFVITGGTSSYFTLMSEAERNAIVSPNIGLHIYQSDGVEGVWVFKSTGWVFAY